MADVSTALAVILLLLLVAALCSPWPPLPMDPRCCALLLPFATLFLLLLLARTWGSRRTGGASGKRACVLVLGDVGRSPRMQYHAASLARHGYSVSFVGYLGTKPHEDISGNEKIEIVPLSEVKWLSGVLLRYPTKVVFQSLQLLWVLLRMEPLSHLLLQNPPGLPSIAISWLACALRGSRFVIDWHNYGYSILALSHGERHPIVRLAKRYEKFFGRLSGENLCVTNAMKDDLSRNWGIEATTLYDRPPALFREATPEQRHSLLVKMSKVHSPFRTSCDGSSDRDDVERTAFTERDPSTGLVTPVAGRPALLLSSTSWTEDEDFSVLLKALKAYEGFVKGGATLPSLVCVITGKGPQKEHYRRIIDSMNFTHVHICTPWLEAEDYPMLLGSADLGVCLHKSSSGLDLPMKVVDMFVGGRLRYHNAGCRRHSCETRLTTSSPSSPSLDELVKHDENGLVFQDAEELAQQLRELLWKFPQTQGRLARFRKTLRESGQQRWDESWDQTVLPLLAGGGGTQQHLKEE
uniref:Chitobiosyldiphosphodolichol beta-mannosyltransferase n=1 Tax=Scleropages formosus TaxID=113540 RepID=A0A8C9TWM1_SCLFO